jgi:hypothetical protein
VFLQNPKKEHFRQAYQVRQLNDPGNPTWPEPDPNLSGHIGLKNIKPIFDVSFTAAYDVYLGKSISIDFTVSDGDHEVLTVNQDASCPIFTTLSNPVINSYRLTVSPSLNGFSLLGPSSCKLILRDSIA